MPNQRSQAAGASPGARGLRSVALRAPRTVFRPAPLADAGGRGQAGAHSGQQGRLEHERVRLLSTRQQDSYCLPRDPILVSSLVLSENCISSKEFR